MTEQGRGMVALRSKADPSLWKAIKRAQFDPALELPVMVVIEPKGGPSSAGHLSGPHAAEAGASAFDPEVRLLVEELRRAGATDIRPDWISRSVLLRGGLAALEAAAARTDVREIVLDTRRNVMA